MRLLTSIVFTLVGILAQAQDFTIEHFAVDIAIQPDGSLQIEETIEVDFSERRRGIFRTIPERYTFEGQEVYVRVTGVVVRDHQYAVSKKGRDREIRIGNPNKYLTGKQRYIISYKASYPIIQHDKYQELYWNVTGNDWQTSIAKSTLTLRLPTDLALTADDLKVWTGKRGSMARAASFEQLSTTTFRAEADAPLLPGQGMTVALKLPADFLTIPADSQIRSRGGAAGDSGTPPDTRLWWLSIPIGIMALLYGWWQKLRDREIQPVYNKKYEYYPPEGLTSAHVGAFIDQRANKRDVLSLIPYWAAEGYLSMRYDGGLTLRRRAALPADFPVYEIDLFDQLFSQGDTVEVDKLKGRLSSAVLKAQMKLGTEVNLQDYFDEEYEYWWRSWRTVLVGLLSLAGGFVAIFVFGLLTLGIGLIVLAVGIGVLSLINKPLSPKGKHLILRLRALKQFMTDSPAEDLSRLVEEDPLYFDRMLPFAVAFGLDKSWLQQVTPYMRQSPSWYEHRSGMEWIWFADTFRTADIDKSFTVDPTPVSSGGGFSGGGSSGGGFGGGGGGSW